MTSSSSEPEAVPQIDVAELDEAASIEDSRAAERALGEVQGRRGGGWLTFARIGVMRALNGEAPGN